jgi:hypothetical protein
MLSAPLMEAPAALVFKPQVICLKLFLEMNTPHWQYFAALCDDLQKTSRFVELSPDNYKTYSTEYTRLYLAAGSEIDVVAKQLCQKINPSAKADSINDYRKTILQKFPDIGVVGIVLWRYGITVVPWKEWPAGTNPAWWIAYNRVKHQRHLHYNEANLENTLNALAGLLVITGYLYGEELATHKLRPMPELMGFEKYCTGSMGRADPCYLLPGIPKPRKP